MGTVQIDGNFIFTSIVILVNVKVFISAFSYTFLNLFFCVMSIGVYFPAYWLASYLGNYTVSGSFVHTFKDA